MELDQFHVFTPSRGILFMGSKIKKNKNTPTVTEVDFTQYRFEAGLRAENAVKRC